MPPRKPAQLPASRESGPGPNQVPILGAARTGRHRHGIRPDRLRRRG